jgi:hypothetical protein
MVEMCWCGLPLEINIQSMVRSWNCMECKSLMFVAAASRKPARPLQIE